MSAKVLRMQHENQRIESVSRFSANPLVVGFIGGPDRDRTDDLFHAMEARSQLRHRPTLGEELHLFSSTGCDSSNLAGTSRKLLVSK